MLKKLIVLVVLLLASVPVFAQSVDTAWVRRYNGPGSFTDYAWDLTLDGSGCIYVTGWSYGSGSSYDYATIKYYPDGDTAWVRRYDGPGNSVDSAHAIAVDDSGYVYVTGWSYGISTSYDYATIKYDPSGNELWVRRYNGSANSNDYAWDICVDAFSNVYVTGESYSNGLYSEYLTIKYDKYGNEIWVRSYNGPGPYIDAPRAITVDKYNNVYVTGISDGGSETSLDYATIKYDPDGNELWSKRYNGPGVPFFDDGAMAMTVDDSGDVYVTGYSNGSGTYFDYATIKYYPNGDTAWVRRYTEPSNAWDAGHAIVVDGLGNVYVTGFSYHSGSGYDYGTIKYYPNGDTAWVRKYDGGAGGYDDAYGIAVDDNGNVYLTGRSIGVGTFWDYATVKYDSIGGIAWSRRYGGPGNTTDGAHALAIDDSGNVYVTGYSYNSGTDFDYVTIKYFQFLRGDANGDDKLTVSDVIYLINYLFKGGPAPTTSLVVGDANCDGKVTVSDVVYIVNYLFKGGPPPCS